jgi:hypothetical protein
VIVRISGEGQFRLPDAARDRINELDNQVVQAVEAGDEARFHELFGRLLELVRTDCERLGEDELVESDVIIPPPDTTMAEAAADFTGDGLIPERA